MGPVRREQKNFFQQMYAIFFSRFAFIYWTWFTWFRSNERNHCRLRSLGTKQPVGTITKRWRMILNSRCMDRPQYIPCARSDQDCSPSLPTTSRQNLVNPEFFVRNPLYCPNSAAPVTQRRQKFAGHVICGERNSNNCNSRKQHGVGDQVDSACKPEWFAPPLLSG